MRLQTEGRHVEGGVSFEHLHRFVANLIMIGIQREPYAVRHIVGVGEHSLIVQCMSVDRPMRPYIGRGRKVGADGLAPCLTVVP